MPSVALNVALQQPRHRQAVEGIAAMLEAYHRARIHRPACEIDPFGRPPIARGTKKLRCMLLHENGCVFVRILWCRLPTYGAFSIQPIGSIC